MANILFLAHRIPYPPNKGDKIRSWNFLKELAKEHTVHLGFFIDNPDDEVHVSFLESHTASLCYETVKPFKQKLLSLRSFLTNDALTVGAYPYGKLKKYVRSLVKKKEIDLIFLFSAATGPIVPNDIDIPVITDLVDVDSAKWGAYAENAPFPMSWVYAREGKLLAHYERNLADRSKMAYLVSDQEAAVFKKDFKRSTTPVRGLKNGVDIELFSPAQNRDAQKIIIFTGAMDYKPNVEAVIWFVEKVWEGVRIAEPSAKFVVAGGPENPVVRKLEGYEGVEVTGYVDSMPEMLQSADIAVAPLLTARGIQNKVLEAMACALPVVASTAANEGIEAEHGKAVYVGDTAADFKMHLLTLLEKPALRELVGQRARQFVETEFSWDSACKQLNQDITKVLADAG